jgi:hypothetical protein
MFRRAKDGAGLDALALLVMETCRSTAESHPRTGPGRPPVVPDWVLATMIVVGTLLKKKTKSATFLWWRTHEADFARWMPNERLPGRSTFYERYRRLAPLFRPVMLALTQQAIQRRWADATCVAVDKSLIASRGRKWSSSQRRRGRVKPGVDVSATWGYSQHDGWVQGYGYEVVTTAAKQGPVWLLLGSVDTASRSERHSFLEKVSDLPFSTKYVLADAGYDSNTVAEAVEWTADQRRTGRRFIAPEIPRPNVGRKRKPGSRETRERQYHRRLRDARRVTFQHPWARRLYARRKSRVEPFHAHFKHLFEFQDRVCHWGIENNRTHIMAAFVAYQVLLTYNHLQRRPNAKLQHILDRL